MSHRHPANDLYELEAGVGTADAEAEIYGSKSYAPKCTLTLADGTALNFDDEPYTASRDCGPQGMSREKLDEHLAACDAMWRKK